MRGQGRQGRQGSGLGRDAMWRGEAWRRVVWGAVAGKACHGLSLPGAGGLRDNRAMAKTSHPTETPATAWLKQHQVHFELRPYDYVEHGGTAESSRQLGVPEHQVVKTLVMQDEAKRPLVVLMHGDCSVSTKQLARAIGVKSVQICDPEVAQRHSGYLVGGTSPFGLRKPMPVYVEQGILELPQICINGGRRGLLVALSPQVLVSALAAKPVECALPERTGH